MAGNAIGTPRQEVKEMVMGLRSILTSVAGCFRADKTKRPRPSVRRASLTVEGLENRDLMAVCNSFPAFQTVSLPVYESGSAVQSFVQNGGNLYTGVGGGVLSYRLPATTAQILQPVYPLAGIGAPGGVTQAQLEAYLFAPPSSYGGYGGYGYGGYGYGGYGYGYGYGYGTPNLLPQQNPLGYGVSLGGAITPGFSGPYARF
jgi:hypothetical protein